MTDDLGTLLRALRDGADLTQEQVAERSGVSVRTIRRLESGRSTNHRMGTVSLLADALDLGAEDRRRLADTLAGRGPRGGARTGHSGGRGPRHGADHPAHRDPRPHPVQRDARPGSRRTPRHRPVPPR
ncbi:helix-turn-helix transcriptional regulator [Streptomyces subrutilus]|uniref:helix-turn-helix transcriptional regulator n=1 Tax=Streptomyces subrutilus TaxID=36818 RepID=UPI00227D96BC|nr:helix-turn-helix domain-containing protein [Streptomyces subrutilus]